jgi:large subunit ribosomal protein L5
MAEKLGKKERRESPKPEKGEVKESKGQEEKSRKLIHPDGYLPRLLKMYTEQVIPEMMKRHSFTNRLQVPRLQKITVNIGCGEGSKEIKILDAAVKELGLITGQKPVITRAKKSIANFKLREGMPIGCMVTLRGYLMYEFLDRLVNLSIPRIRDFRGLSPRSFDGRGNYTFGIKEQMIFPEVNVDQIVRVQGMNITLSFKDGTDELSKEILKLLGFPFSQ